MMLFDFWPKGEGMRDTDDDKMEAGDGDGEGEGECTGECDGECATEREGDVDVDREVDDEMDDLKETSLCVRYSSLIEGTGEL